MSKGRWESFQRMSTWMKACGLHPHALGISPLTLRAGFALS